MMSTTSIYPLCLLLCCCWCVDETLGTAVKPGLKIRLSQPGLNYAAGIAVEIMSAKVHTAALPDQSGHSHTPVGNVNYEVKNVKVCFELSKFEFLLSRSLLLKS